MHMHHLLYQNVSWNTQHINSSINTVAPRIRGQQGSASIPTVTPNGDVVFNTWAKICSDENKVISCYSDDGRIVVNSELSAASNIFAAGSVAKYPNHITGHATVAGEGVLDGSQAGDVAATNMSKDYHLREGKERHNVPPSSNIFSNNKSLSVCRSDRLSTTSSPSLSSVGIHALCVGQCDSETMSTHGFWWTNQSRRLTRRRSILSSSQSGRSRKPVYGQGVVYYLDRAGTIRGVMLWGLPFTKSSKSPQLNNPLIERMKNIIHTNGDAMQKDHADEIIKMRLDPDLLYPSHLAEESRILATMAINKSQSDQIVRKKVPRPLHRFLPSKPISVTKTGVLKRNEKIGTGSVGEDIFERAGHDIGSIEGERSRNPSLVHYFDYDWSSSRPMSLDDLDSEEEDIELDGDDLIYQPVSKNPDHAARPSKEEALWMRKGEIAKTQSFNEKINIMFMQNIRQGSFSDGSDAVKQAPTPQVISDAKKWINDRTGDSNEDNEF